MLSLENINEVDNHKKKQIICKGCENHCTISRFEFGNGNMFFGGNKCERIFSSKGKTGEKG
ncbi:MAG: hypothetical protein LBH84_00410, partial [Prevotellaceae bacterium]|nr:hypothetical protein [Prevotellaceae bacterium]